MNIVIMVYILVWAKQIVGYSSKSTSILSTSQNKKSYIYLTRKLTKQIHNWQYYKEKTTPNTISKLSVQSSVWRGPCNDMLSYKKMDDVNQLKHSESIC